MNAAAPFYHDIALGSATATAVWVKARDGVRLRVGIWSNGTKGTILLFPGRTETVEKYGLAAAELAQRGFATLAIDWRGQGLADRLRDNPLTGDVTRFDDYQLDVDALMRVAECQEFPKPYYLLAHSMGGAIGFRALQNGLPVKAAVFSAPMWGIEMAPILRPFAWALSWVSRYLWIDHWFAPGTTKRSYVTSEPFIGNKLTSDPAMYDYMREQTMAHPELALGGPSLLWLYEALRELRRQSKEAPPTIPTLTFLGSEEKIVQCRPIYNRMRRWPNGALDLVEGGRHEVMMETQAIRTDVFDKIGAHFEAYP